MLTDGVVDIWQPLSREAIRPPGYAGTLAR